MTAALQPHLALAPAALDVERRDDTSLVLRSPQPLQPGVRCLGDWLRAGASRHGDRPLLAERTRAGDGWRQVTYAGALDAATRIGQALLDRGLGPERPLMILSENGVDHGLLTLGAADVGVPVVPVSPAYSLLSSDHAKLRAIARQVTPGAVFAADPLRYAKALQALGLPATPIDALLDTAPGAAAADAHARLGPDTLVKVLYTSGSTGDPKGVVNTQRMITANQQQAAQVWRFLDDTPPVIVDWLPWSHTFGGNFTFHLALAHGGTLYVDGGRPMPGAIEQTVANLREIAPTLYCNVPRGFDLLLPYLESDAAFRRHFFSRCEMVFYAAAALPQPLWDRLERLAQAERQGRMALVSAWGSTETAPMATAVHYADAGVGVIGLPVPGCEIKLVPNAGKLEARLRGPNITPGYWRQPALTVAAFDEEGFYRIGDALRFADEARPERGLVFDGRVAEDFKLNSGTWVHVGALRLRLVEAGDGLIQDAAITGHGRDQVGALLFLHPARAAALAPQALQDALHAALQRLRSATTGSSLFVQRALVTAEAPSMDAGEINDKGYLNQRAVLMRRAGDVARLYAMPHDPDVIVLA